MRTTVTLDADTEELIRRRMRSHKVSFKRALNDAIREGCRPAAESAAFRTRTARMGAPLISLDRALQVAAELEDEELLLRLRSGA
jgi:hypothetical protein